MTPKLSARAVVRDLLERFDLQADKAFGQNFLVDAFALANIVDAAELSPHDHVFEVGPGLGVLTQALAQTGAHVTSLELDERLLTVLQETVGDYPNLKVVHTDALEFDFSSAPKDSVLVANLPYNIATPLIQRVLASGRFKRLVFLVQKEVAERLTASPGSKAYSALSIVMTYFGETKRLRDVKPGSFMPPPKVMSSVVRINVHPNAYNYKDLFDFIHQSFRHRRKTLRKNLIMAGFLESKVTKALSQLELDDRLRAEALELKQFESLFEILK